jgi:hypothetical protein
MGKMEKLIFEFTIKQAIFTFAIQHFLKNEGKLGC